MAAAQPASQNKLVQIGVIGMAEGKNAYDKPSMDAVKDLRKDAKPLVADTDLRLGFTGPAPQALFEAEESGDRRFAALVSGGSPLDVEERLTKEVRFDSDLWIIEIDDRQGRHFLDLAE